MCRKTIKNDVFANLIRSPENSSWNYENKKIAYFFMASWNLEIWCFAYFFCQNVGHDFFHILGNLLREKHKVMRTRRIPRRIPVLWHFGQYKGFPIDFIKKY